MTNFVALGMTLAAAVLLGAVSEASAAAFADLVLIHGRIITVNAKDDVTEAVAVQSGRIVEVGSD